MSAHEQEPTWELVTDFSVLQSGQRVKVSPCLDCGQEVRGMLGGFVKAVSTVYGTQSGFDVLPFHRCAVQAGEYVVVPMTVWLRRVWREVLYLGGDPGLIRDIQKADDIARGVTR